MRTITMSMSSWRAETRSKNEEIRIDIIEEYRWRNKVKTVKLRAQSSCGGRKYEDGDEQVLDMELS